MLEFKGITVGTYISKKVKKGQPKDVCSNCEMIKKLQMKKADKEKEYEICKNCEKCYVSKSSKALLTVGRDQTSGKINRKTFVADTEEMALHKALEFKLELDKNGGPRIITKSNKTLVELVKPVLEEQYKLKDIKASTFKRKNDTLKKIGQEKFANKPIAKVTREEVVNFLATLVPYSTSTIKQIYELICIGYGEASSKKIIEENFMAGYRRVIKPKSEYDSNKRKSLTIKEEKILVDYLNSVDYNKCRNKYLFLLMLTTGIRIGEALVIDYEKDIDLEKNELTIRRTQTKDEHGKMIIGETTKTDNSLRTIKMNNISRSIIEQALKHKIKNKDRLLFCQANGNMHQETSINSCLKRIAIRLNIGTYEDENQKGKIVTKTDVHNHMLRGTFATRCAEAKIAPVVLQQILGHKDIKITLEYYIDVDTEFIESETDNAIQYLVDKNIFGVVLPEEKVA